MNSVGVDESKSDSMTNWICEFCTFEDPNGKEENTLLFRRGG